MGVPELERQMGISAYLTTTAGFGGAIRGTVEDFVVEETLVDGSTATTTQTAATKPALGATAERRTYLLCVLVKRNWDTFIALKNIARELGVEPAKIQIAGIKDAKAVTAQYITLKGVTAQQAADVQVKDMQLRPLGYFREALCPFYLLGNNFKIAISNIQADEAEVEQQTAQVAEQVAAAGGIPNFFGHQRFGTTRVITHLVGKAMVNGDFAGAAMVFLGNPSPNEHPQSQKARAELQESGDFKQALAEFPVQLRFERVMLRHLAEDPADFAGAFRRLPLKLRTLFVQAWQSYLFNRFLSARLNSGLGLGTAEAGDFVVGVERSGLPLTRTGKFVAEANVAEVNRQIAAGKLRVALPIFGSRQRLSEGKTGEMQRQILQEEGVTDRGFWVRELPEVNSKGELRAAVCPVCGFTADKAAPDLGGLRLPLQFRLLRGAYATVLLRELIKPKDLIAAGF
ncbi:MAG: tRNA pseudouridine(13) synthase TruD [Candidatus Bathyarchaeia archaeon]